jgi:hypothetical protein
MKQTLLSVFTLVIFNAGAQNCVDLFISEYVEGSGNNKALEIYNPTSVSIDLSAYIVIRYSNGATSASASNAVQLVGTLSPNDVHVGVIEKLNNQGVGQDVPVADSLQDKADAFYCPDYNISNAWYWNGNDAIVLAKGSVNDITNAVIIDVFGKVGENPTSGAWTADPASGFTEGAWWTQNHTLIRKSSVVTGDANPIDLFNPSLEWDSIPQDSWDNLGEHTCNCSSSTTFDELNEKSYTMFPNPVNRGELVQFISSHQIKSIIVTNILGEQVIFDSSINTIDLVKGLYIVDVEFSNGNFVANKLIIN